jgi:hypothetical protein
MSMKAGWSRRWPPVEAERAWRWPRFHVEVVEHLDVVAGEADGGHHHVAGAGRGQAADLVANGRLEPRVSAGCSGSVGGRPATVRGMAEAGRDQADDSVTGMWGGLGHWHRDCAR